VILLAILTLVIGLKPDLVGSLLRGATEDLVNSMGYIRNVLTAAGGGL
jgi:hypothetical protein